MISVLNLISFLFLAVMLAMLLIRVYKKPRLSDWALVLAMLLLTFTTITNILEHIFHIPEFDQWEDMLEILFLPTLILSLHIAQLQKELKKRLISERKFEAILNNATTFIGLLDANGNLLDANERALQFTGEKLEDIRGLPFEETGWWVRRTMEQTKLKKAIQEAKNGNNVHLEVTHENDKGEVVYIDFSLTPIFNEAHEVVYLVPEGRDITAIKKIQYELEGHRNHLEEMVNAKTRELNAALDVSKQLNRKLYHVNQTLEAKNEELKQQSDYLKQTLDELKSTQNQLIESEKMASLGILTAGMAHEINNPLNYIMGGVTGIDQFATEQMGERAPEIKGPIEAIYSGINRISNIIKSLNSYSRTDDSDAFECNINNILLDSLIILENKYRDRITIRKDFIDQAVVMANEGRLHQVFLNLLDNAIQAIEDRGEITLSTSITQNRVVVSVQDTGMGINSKNLKRIFDPFFTTKSPGEGTGLGLSISKRIIAEYKGEITITSQEGKGSLVRVSFPYSGSKDTHPG